MSLDICACVHESECGSVCVCMSVCVHEIECASVQVCACVFGESMCICVHVGGEMEKIERL